MKSISKDNKFQILLLTNRDSDNVGDQVIEACDIALVRAVMKNLNIDKDCYNINSRAAAIVTKQYMATKNENLLKGARRAISKSDLVLFGGAPLFNYKYQGFYERTAVTVELAKKFKKPVIFSAIGVEGYDETNPKCMRLKETLNYSCVKQITTRDDFDALQNYKENEKLVIARVSDPAVFAVNVFSENFKMKFKRKIKEFWTAFKRTIKGQKAEKIPVSNKKKIGIFVLRANGFVDNHVDFSREEAAALWLDLIKEITARGYDYELLTSGHFGDEAFLDYLIRHYGVPADKCIFNMNLPEILIKQMRDYDGIVSCRLHPSIIGFSLGIPAVGLVWNEKVTGFYDGIGYPERAIHREDFNAKAVADRLEGAMQKGIQKDEDHLMSVYVSLFNGIKRVACPKAKIKPYDYQTLLKNIPVFEGTSETEQQEKLKRKFRRTYETVNKRFDDNLLLKEKLKENR